MGFLKALLLVASVAFGQQPQPQALIGAPYRDFSGGYNDTVSPSNLPPNQSPNLLNVKIDDPPGSLKPREGYRSCGITPSGLPATVLYEYNYNSSGGVPRFIVSDSSNVWQTQDCVSFTTVTTRLSGTVLPSITTVRDKLWIVSTSTHVITWNGLSSAILDGGANTPNPAPPRAAFIEFWNERVWTARTSANPSGVYFSDLTDTLGNDLDPSTGTLAWPADNVIQIAQENGSPITGIKVYRNALFVWKENGIWRIDFNGPFDITVSKTLSSAGTKYQKSIVEHENLIYFVGIDGMYVFDGDRAVRISESFRNKFASINQNSLTSSQKSWDTQTEFNLGTSSLTNTDNSIISISTNPTGLVDGTFEGYAYGISTGGFSCQNPGGGGRICQAIDGSIGGSRSARVFGLFPLGVGDITYSFFNIAGSTVASGFGENECVASGTASTITINASSFNGTAVFAHFQAGDVHLYSSSFTARGSISFRCIYDAQDGWSQIDDITSFQYYSSGTQTSEIYNAVSVSSWTTFVADEATNGGSISYYVKVGSNTGAVAARPWVSIANGGLISGTTDQTYIQWSATLTATSNLLVSPTIDSIVISYLSGTGSPQSIYSYSKNGNLYISASTGSSNSNNIVFVRSKTPLDSWTIYDWKVGPMSNFNNYFYAASSTDTKLYRMNYGTNDNGQAIPWLWESREDTFERPNIRKYLMEINLDYIKGTESALTAGYSRDSGVTYTTKSVSSVGSGRGTSRLYVAGSNATDYRFRVSGSSLDGTVTILGLTGWVRPAVLRE